MSPRSLGTVPSESADRKYESLYKPCPNTNEVCHCFDTPHFDKHIKLRIFARNSTNNAFVCKKMSNFAPQTHAEPPCKRLERLKEGALHFEMRH